MFEPAQSTPAGKRLVMVTGVQRSGTTAVFEALAKSPGVTAREESADDDIYVNFFLRPESQIRSLLHSLPGTVLLKPVRETERRPLQAIADEYAAYDLSIIWLHRNPLHVFSSYVRLGWRPENLEAATAFANEWAERNESALAALPMCGSRILVVQHEDLVMHPDRLPLLANVVGLSTGVTLGMNISEAAPRLAPALQSVIEARTADVRRRLEAVSGLYRQTAGESTEVADPSQSVLYHPAYSAPLGGGDPAVAYARWRVGGALQTVSHGDPWFVATGYEAARLVLAASMPHLPFPCIDRALREKASALDLFFRDLRSEWRTGVRQLVASRVKAHGAGDPFTLDSLILPLIGEVNAAWMGCPGDLLDVACKALVFSTSPQNGHAMPPELARLVADLRDTGLLRRLIDQQLLDPTDAAAFIFGTAVRTYMLSMIVPNALGVAARSPPVLDRLRADPAAIPRFLLEALRLTPNWVAVKRICAAPLTVGGRDIPPNAMVDVLVGVANRDPAAYAQPDLCMLDRPGPPTIMPDPVAAPFLRLEDDAPWPEGSLLLDTATVVLEALIAGDRPLRIVVAPTTRLVPWPDGSCVAVSGEMFVALGG